MVNKLESLFFLGRPFGPLYGVAMSIREQLYKKQVFSQHTLGVPVISVGNLVLGGTGKTPTVMFLAELLSENGYAPAIVSRGYGGKARGLVNIVSNGTEILLDANDAGDEPALLASTLGHTPVLTGKKRINPCRYAVEKLGVDCIILDDGFQHMGVARDINLVLFDADNLAGNSRIFPAGPLREPVSALNRTTAFLITGQNPSNSKRSEAFAELLHSKFPDTPVFTAQNCNATLMRTNQQEQRVAEICDAYVFCAIANPERVTTTAEDLGVHVIHSKYLQDHKQYNQTTVTELCKDAEARGATCLITTAKDFVKIKSLTFSLPIFILQIQQQPEQAFIDYILENMPGKNGKLSR
ncbi:tetraacyldisaccharide 4'-kinase [Desulforhopalus sp. 52FAK]